MTNNALTTYNAPPQVPAQAAGDAQLVELWLHSKRSEGTQRAYRYNVARFLAWVDKPLRQITMADLQAFAETLGGKAIRTQARAIGAVKSLLTFAQKVGYIQFNIGSAVPIPRPKETLSQRILTEAQIHRLIALEENPRNHALLLVLYAAGPRVAELCRLSWRDLQERQVDGQVTGQLTFFGKGSKTRVVLLPPAVWAELVGLRGDAGVDDPVFRSRTHGAHLDPAQVLRIVRAAAKRAGVEGNVSPHWFRHSHATHALERQAPLHLVQQTLGHASIETTGRYLHARPSDSSARYLAV